MRQLDLDAICEIESGSLNATVRAAQYGALRAMSCDRGATGEVRVPRGDEPVH